MTLAATGHAPLLVGLSDRHCAAQVESKAMITPVILCGGSGTRLWPLSRKSLPKQFVPLVGDKSLLQTTLDRVALLSQQVVCFGTAT